MDQIIDVGKLVTRIQAAIIYGSLSLALLLIVPLLTLLVLDLSLYVCRTILDRLKVVRPMEEKQIEVTRKVTEVSDSDTSRETVVVKSISKGWESSSITSPMASEDTIKNIGGNIVAFVRRRMSHDVAEQNLVYEMTPVST